MKGHRNGALFAALGFVKRLQDGDGTLVYAGVGAFGEQAGWFCHHADYATRSVFVVSEGLGWLEGQPVP